MMNYLSIRYCKNNKILPKSNLDILQQENYIEKGDDEILHSLNSNISMITFWLFYINYFQY